MLLVLCLWVVLVFDWISLCLGAGFGAICLAVGVVYLADYAVFCSPPFPFPALLRFGGASAGYRRRPQYVGGAGGRWGCCWGGVASGVGMAGGGGRRGRGGGSLTPAAGWVALVAASGWRGVWLGAGTAWGRSAGGGVGSCASGSPW